MTDGVITFPQGTTTPFKPIEERYSTYNKRI